jgi:hypothetical protein
MQCDKFQNNRLSALAILTSVQCAKLQRKHLKNMYTINVMLTGLISSKDFVLIEVKVKTECSYLSLH